MSAKRHDFIIDQGTDFSFKLTLKQSNGQPVDLTDFTAAAHMKLYATDVEPAAAFDIVFDDDRESGIFYMNMAKEVTGALAPGDYRYDLEYTSPSNITKRIIEGVVKVTPEITRDE
jgi:hypothetical protein